MSKINLVVLVVIIISTFGFFIASGDDYVQIRGPANPSIINYVQKLPDLTGVYHSDNQGIFYVKQTGSKIYWYGQENSGNPYWANIAFGTIDRNFNPATITLTWIDVPKGQTTNSGTLTLTASYQGSSSTDQVYTLRVTQQTGGFGPSVLTRSIPA
jgi:hypothetical protein